MASNQLHALSFTIAAMPMGLAGFRAIFSLVVAAGPSHFVTIENSFRKTNLLVHCHSDTQFVVRANMHTVQPKEAYVFPFDPKVQRYSDCFVKTEQTKGVLCSQVKKGDFFLWQARVPPMCDRNCSWFAGPDGLSLIKHQGAKPVHVYNWQLHQNATQNATYNC